MITTRLCGFEPDVELREAHESSAPAPAAADAASARAELAAVFARYFPARPTDPA